MKGLSDKGIIERIISGSKIQSYQMLNLFDDNPTSEEGLKSLFLWGKNYLHNSEIKYEYYLNGLHQSYPDFIMKDTKGVVHIFEVKSVNVSNTLSINKEEYETKINALKECYKYSSKLTGHIFYLPILDGEDWKIIRFKNGQVDTISVSQLYKSFQ
ncbi:MAG: hypothetical protein MJ003_04325 [Paludibacteraceae bacterium]|nr:hypothetical protein [Paludibacteraceae bacterium]